MSDPVQTVRNFVDQWRVSEAAMLQSFRDYFTPTTVWDNVGLARTTGIDEALALMAGFGTQLGIATIVVDMLNIAANGNVVLTERVDRFFDKEGKERGAVRVMGAFEIKDGKVVDWRDYFDSAAVKPQG